MSEHASTIAIRMGIGTVGLVGIIEYLVSGDITWTSVILGLAIGFVVWASSYIIVYVIEQWLYETGRLTRPWWMTGEKHPVDEMKEIINDDLPTEKYEVDVTLFRLLQALAQTIFWAGNMEKISRRQLESYGIVKSRTGPDAVLLMRYLISEELVDDIGNSQYAVTERLKKRLTEITGVKSNDEPVRADTPQVA